MPAVLVGIAAVGVALLLLLIAYALTVLFTPIIEGVLREIPFVGGVLAGKAKRALDWSADKVIGYANTGLHMLTGWFSALADLTADFVDSVNAFVVGLPDQLLHLVKVTVPELIKLAVNPIGEIAHYAKQTVDALVARVEAIADLPLSHFKGIEHGVDNRLGHLRDIVENVDLPDLHTAIERQIHGSEQAVLGRVNDLTTYTDSEFGKLWDQLHKIPLQQLLDGLAAATVAGALVNVIATEAGLGRAECRGKVKSICATDPLAWQALLDVAGIALAFMGIREFVALAQDFARETLPQIVEGLHGN